MPTLARLNSGLTLPEGMQQMPRHAPIDYVGTFVSLKDYLSPSQMPGGSPESVVEQVISSQDPRVLLLQLAYLNHLCTSSPGQINRFVEGYRNVLSPNLRSGLSEALQKEGNEGPEALLFARQAVLAAIRTILEAHPWTEGLEQPSLATAILLVHAVGSSTSEFAPDGTQAIGTLPANLLMELVRNGMLCEQDDDYSILDRTLRYWQEHVANLERTELREDSRSLLEQALGLTFEDFFALGCWVWLLARNRNPASDPNANSLTLSTRLPGVSLPRDRIERFLEKVSAPAEWFSREFEGRESQYDFLPIQTRPVLRLAGSREEQLLVLDEPFLLQKFTLTGLFWAIHDNERDNHGDNDRLLWTQAHGEALEGMVEESLLKIAPALHDSNRRRSFYTEEDLREAYPDTKITDAVVDYGDRVLVFEVVSGQPAVGTRVAGDPESFKRDTERLVLKKARQLDETCSSILSDQPKLMGYDAPYDRRIVPIVVVAGGYPSDALSRSHVDDELVARGLLQHAAIEPLCLLSLGELEMIESLHETGKHPGELLGNWRRSSLRNISFRNYALREVDADLERPSRMTKRVHEAKDDAIRRLSGQ